VPTVEEKLQRLAKEREEADRRYNEALTALDKAVTGRLDVPDPSPAFDDHQIDALNDMSSGAVAVNSVIASASGSDPNRFQIASASSASAID